MTHHKKKLLTAAYIGGGLLQPKNPHIISYKRRRNNNNLGPSLLFAIDDKDDIIAEDGIAYNNGGSYVDLGTITAPFNDEAAESLLQNYLYPLLSTKSDNNPITSSSSSQQLATTSNNIEEWRSNHWIVLIDDEPSIRLAIGDYLHSMGYTMITACDGPQSFLDVLLYSCGWSLIVDSNNVGAAGGNSCAPPWMSDSGDDESTMMLWRLPNCIISDIRMPGGVDGVQLLELLRRSKDDNNNNRRSSNSEDDDSSGGDYVKKKGKKNKGRRSKKGEATERSNNEYDGKDDFELLDAIVGNGGGSNKDGSSSSTTTRKQQRQQEAGKIVTAIDQAIQKLDVISDTLIYHQKKVRCNSNSPSLQQRQQEQQQYPTTLAQIPVILLTAKAMVSDRIVGFKAGANNYLPKPFRPEELLGMVDSLLRKQERERKEWIVSDDLLLGSSSDDYIVATVKQQQQNSDEEGKYVDEELVESYYSASAQQVKDLTTELIEIKNLLKEEAQRQTNAKAEQEEVERLTKLLPEALWMFMNDERRKRLFTTDHIRSILIFCFDDTALARKSIVKRDDLLAELERRNDENPDLVQDFLLD